MLLGESKFMKTIPPPENLDSEIDAMVEEIYEARAKFRARKPAIAMIRGDI